MAVNKIDPKKIFASQAPSQDVPAEFNNYERGWDESRKNNGKPTIKQFNKLQQLTDEKILWMHQNGAALPFDETMEYAEGAVVVKGGELQQWKGEEWKSVIAEGLSDTVQTFNTPEAGVDPVTGVADGAYFNVRSSSDESYVDEYQNVGGSAVATGKSYLSAYGVERQEKPANTIKDASGENQQLLNTGLTTVSQLSQISSPYDGMRMRVKSVIDPNYALARPFIGGGEFFFVADKAAINDGGVVINGWVRIFDGAVKPEWWGADPTGANSSLSAMQSAINYCRNTPARPMSAARGGMGSIELDGVYIWDGALDLSNVNGLTIKAKSRYTTTVIHTPNNGYMFNMQRYLNINFDDIAFFAGTYNFSGDKLVTLPITKGATAFNFIGNGGGRRPTFNRCEFQGFKTVFRTMDDLVNCDTLAANQCDFMYCDTVWENNNPNAVIWAFNDCSFYAYKELFINPANTLRVNGGQAIGETFWKGLSDSPSLNSYLSFKDIRFESYINAVPTAKPKWLDIDCPTTGVVFDGCPMYGIPAGGMDNVETGKVRFRLYGDIKFKNCQVRGYFSVVSAYAGNGSTARITFENCENEPVVNQTYESTANNRYINLIYKDKWTSKTTRVNRTFLTMFNGGGVGSGTPFGSATLPMIDVFSYQSLRTAALTEGRALPIWCPAPYKLNVSKLELNFQKSSSANGFKVTLYRDNTKAVKVAEIDGVGVGKSHGVAEISMDTFLVSAEITATSEPLYIEVVNTENVGLLNLDIHVHLIQQAHSN